MASKCAHPKTPQPDVRGFFDDTTSTVTYVVSDPESGACAIIDPVLGYQPESGRTSTAPADPIIAYVQESGLAVGWILETHIHADHLTAAQHLRGALGGRTGIGADTVIVQRTLKHLFNAEPEFAPDGSQFDHLFADAEDFALGTIAAQAVRVPGHTPSCICYRFGDATFVGDTLFMPDYGTARCDFPGGDARQLYRSIARILAWPDATRLYTCHDYGAPGRDHVAWETTVGEQRRANVHVHAGVSEDDFVAMRTARDATLTLPALFLPAVQFNMRAGRLPPPEDNGTRYLKIPLDVLGDAGPDAE